MDWIQIEGNEHLLPVNSSDLFMVCIEEDGIYKTLWCPYFMDRYGEWISVSTSLPEKDITHFAPWPSAPEQKRMRWQSRTSYAPEWKTITDEEHELFQHLSRFEFRQIEL